MSEAVRRTTGGTSESVIGALRAPSPKEKPVEVGVGEIGYNCGPIFSRDFVNCSAVILDFENRVLMAHAYPYARLDGEQDNHISVENVVRALCLHAEKRGLDIKSCKAVLHGSTDRICRVLVGLREAGIPVAHIDHDTMGGSWRTVEYDPETKEMKITANAKSSLSRSVRC